MKIYVSMLAALLLFSYSHFVWAEDFKHSSLYNNFVAVDAMDGIIDGNASLLTSKLCANCHDININEVMETVHYTFRSENENINYPGGGSHGHYDRSSGITGGNTAVNYTFSGEDGCGRCHVGKYLPGTMNEVDLITGSPTENMKMVRNGIDCLVCHSSLYQGRDRIVQEVTAEGGTINVWYQDRTWRAVESIGKPTTENCLRCHREAASPNERGTPFEPWNDVHIASREFERNACAKCHTVKQHKMVRGNYISEIFASDYKIGSPVNELKCERCHGNTPHEHKKVLNEHVARIACQTCHIPWTSGATYSTWQDDGQKIRYSRENEFGALDTKPYITEGKNERDLWEEYKIRPKYLWFNGRSSYLAQPYGDKNDSNSKIWPFKPLSSGLPVDISGLRMVDVLDDATLQLAMVGTGDMIPGNDPKATAGAGIGTLGNRTNDSSLSREMQEAMYGTPLFFNMDMEILKATSNIGYSISSAMMKMIYTLNFIGRFLGAQNDSPLIYIFNGNYPWGNYRVVKIPTGENMQKELGLNYPSASYLTLSHGVRKKDEALKCHDCHSASGVLNKNMFQAFDRYDANGNPTFKEISNLKVLGYDKSLH